LHDGLHCGVIHAGGVLADGVIASQSAAGVRTVFAPKVTRRGQARAIVEALLPVN